MKNRIATPRPNVLRSLGRTALAFGFLLQSAVAFAGDAREIALTGQSPNHRVSLVGTKMRTIYEQQEYESTCYRDEAYTEYRTECDYRTVQHCTRVDGGRSCTPSCREVSRPVCNSSGCRNVPTRECSESCTNLPDRHVCSDRRESYNCRSVPYIAYHSVPYSCMKTRTVAVGTELEEQISADVSIRVVGDAHLLSGKDVIRVSVADGTDVSRADLTVEMKKSEDTHFLAIRKSEDKRESGDRRSHIVADIEIEAIPFDAVLGRKTAILDLEANRNSVSLVTSGEPIDESVVLRVVAKKDQLIGGLKKVLDRSFSGRSLKAKNVGGNEKVVADLGGCLNKRPHEFEVTLTRDVSKLLEREILNRTAVEKAKIALAAKASKRVKLKGQSCERGDGQF